MAPPSIPNEFSVFGRESMRSDERLSSPAKLLAIFLSFLPFVKCCDGTTLLSYIVKLIDFSLR